MFRFLPRIKSACILASLAMGVYLTSSPPSLAADSCCIANSWHNSTDADGNTSFTCTDPSGNEIPRDGVPFCPTVNSSTETNTNSGTSTSTGTQSSTSLENFTNALQATQSTSLAVIGQRADNSTGTQKESFDAANDVAALGAGQAATLGAIYCAQGATTNLSNSSDAAAYYAVCQQNFRTANALVPVEQRPQGFKVDQATVSNGRAQQTLREFETAFGVGPGEYLRQMLGPGGGPDKLAGLVGDKLASEKLAEAFGAAGDASQSSVSQDPNQIATGPKPGFKKQNTSLRDSLKKKLAEQESAGPDERTLASSVQIGNPAKPTYKDLEPAGAEALGLNEQQQQDLTLFDVVHQKYEQFFNRLLPEKSNKH